MIEFTAISVFCGAGGLDMGFENQGFKTIWANDFDADACKTHESWSGATVVCGDIGKVDAADIPDADAFFGLETGYSDLSVRIVYDISGNAVSLIEMYFECRTDDGWTVAGTYIFDSTRIGGNGEG